MSRWIILSVVLIAIAVAIHQSLNQAERDDAGEIVGGGSVGVFDIRVGDCFSDTASDASTVSSLAAVPCSQPHDNEVYAVFDIDIPTYDSEDWVFERAFEACQARFAGFAAQSYEASALDISALYPSQESWRQDDREVICAVFLVNGEKLVGSAAGRAL